jgi:site-specific recombinase XerD
MKPNPASSMFSPPAAKAEFQSNRRENRRTPIIPSQRNRKAKVNPRKAPGDCYTECSYGQAIRKACLAAEIVPWHPNHLRHSTATEIRKPYSLEAAHVIFAHSQAIVTQIYAEGDFGKAR